jgi:hypothetical protein
MAAQDPVVSAMIPEGKRLDGSAAGRGAAGASRAASDLVAGAEVLDGVGLDGAEDSNGDVDLLALAAEDGEVVEDGEDTIGALAGAAGDLLGVAAVALVLSLLNGDRGALALGSSTLLGEGDRGGGESESDGSEGVHFEGWGWFFGSGSEKVSCERELESEVDCLLWL